MFDYDGDGWMDIYLPTGGPDALHPVPLSGGGHLFRNIGGGRFVDTTTTSGIQNSAWGNGAAAADFDGDGDVDLYLTNWGPNALFVNNGDGTFHDGTAAAGVGHPAWSSSAAFGDVDGDSDLDLYVSNYVAFDPTAVPSHEEDGAPCTYRGVVTGCGPWRYPGVMDTLYRNNGDGTFTDVSEEAGLAVTRDSRGFGVILADLDGDRDVDVYVACDVGPNLYLLNDGTGHFRPAPNAFGGTVNALGQYESGMGVSAGDVDSDGDLDLFVTNFAGETNTLYRNEGGVLIDVSAASRTDLHPSEVGWGTVLADFDSDGTLDVFVANGHIYPQVADLNDARDTYAQPERLYLGRADRAFVEAGPAEGWLPAPRYSTRGIGVGDFDNDGALDLVLVRHNEPVSLWLNQRHRSYLTVTLRGRSPNTQAIGAQVHVHAGGRRQTRTVLPHQGYQSSYDPRLHVGLGADARVDAIEVVWPDGSTTRLDGGPANRQITIDQDDKKH